MKNTDSTARAALNLWNEAIPTFEQIVGMKIRLVYPGESDPYHQWFLDLESGAFRIELRYSSEELEERLVNNNLLFFFLVSEHGNESVLLAYDDPDNPDDILYVDTIAIRTSGRGLGTVLMQILVKYAKLRAYKSIRLDTEIVNERGQELVKFYLNLGFSEISTTEDGNVSMELKL